MKTNFRLPQILTKTKQWLIDYFNRLRLAELINCRAEIEMAHRETLRAMLDLDRELTQGFLKMEFSGKPIAMPLPAEIKRCQGHGLGWGEKCHLSNTCACYISMLSDGTPMRETLYRKCTTEKMALYVPIHGFFDDSERQTTGQSKLGSAK